MSKVAAIDGEYMTKVIVVNGVIVFVSVIFDKDMRMVPATVRQ